MIDYKKLVRQESAFEEFAKSVTFEVLLKNDPSFINVLFSFYQSDLTADQTIAALTSFMKINESLQP